MPTVGERSVSGRRGSHIRLAIRRLLAEVFLSSREEVPRWIRRRARKLTPYIAELFRALRSKTEFDLPRTLEPTHHISEFRARCEASSIDLVHCRGQPAVPTEEFIGESYHPRVWPRL
jgi:hypothetical protein